MTEYPNIIVLDYPEEVNFSEWSFEHPECDCIIQQIGTGPKAMLYAYSKSKAGNEELRIYRNKYLEGYEILVGLSENAISSLLCTSVFL